MFVYSVAAEFEQHVDILFVLKYPLKLADTAVSGLLMQLDL